MFMPCISQAFNASCISNLLSSMVVSYSCRSRQSKRECYLTFRPIAASAMGHCLSARDLKCLSIELGPGEVSDMNLDTFGQDPLPVVNVMICAPCVDGYMPCQHCPRSGLRDSPSHGPLPDGRSGYICEEVQGKDTGRMMDPCSQLLPGPLLGNENPELRGHIVTAYNL